jgi:hypothetical protein
MNRHTPYWMPEWQHPGPLVRSSKMDPAICKALDDMEYEQAHRFVMSQPVDESQFPPAGTRTLRVKRFPFVKKDKTHVL